MIRLFFYLLIYLIVDFKRDSAMAEKEMEASRRWKKATNEKRTTMEKVFPSVAICGSSDF